MIRSFVPVSGRPIVAAGFLLALLAPPALAEVAAPIPMAAHHATYKLSLLKSTGTNAPASATGVIDYVFSGSSCEGYTTTFRQLTELQPAEGEARLNDLRSTTFEDAAGTQFNFKTTTKNDTDTVSDVDGSARKQSDGKINVELKRPVGTAALGGDVLFPTEHLRKIIETAKAGGKILVASVFDGSDTGKKVFRTLSVIGAPVDTPSGDASGRTDSLKSMRRWPVAISYFEGSKEDQPDYVLSFDLYEDGISRALKLDYGDFVLAGDLTELSLTAEQPCH